MFPIANGVPLRYPPVATWALIAANCVIFLFQLSLSPSELDLFLDHLAEPHSSVGAAGSGALRAFEAASSPTPVSECECRATCTSSGYTI